MSIKPIDARTLWGRSGNRCAICSIELTPEGSTTTLGQMCHIVGKKEGGPRGKNTMTSEERDRYENLILLCRNHHGEIDDNESAFPIERLHEIKSKHETWVTAQLSSSAIKIRDIDNSDFLNSRRSNWISKIVSEPAVVCSITPLNISQELIDPTTTSVVSLMNVAKYSSYGELVSVNHRYTHPSPNGLRNETLTIDGAASKHSIEIDRNGHLEYLTVVSGEDYCVNASSEALEKHRSKLFFYYPHIAAVIDSSIDWIVEAKNLVQPENDMLFQFLLLNASGTNLFAKEIGPRRVLGVAVDTEWLSYQFIVSTNIDADELKYDVLSRLSNSFGLTLSGLRGVDGKYIRPDGLYN